MLHKEQITLTPAEQSLIQFIRETGGIELMKTLNFVLGHAVVNRSMPDEPPGIPPEHCGKFYFFVELTQRIALTEAEA